MMETKDTINHNQLETTTAQTTTEASPQTAVHPWVKPTFERIPLNEAMASFTPSANPEGASFYYS